MQESQNTNNQEKNGKTDFDWMIHWCKPTPSQEQKLDHCPFARQSDVCKESLLMSSLGPTQPDPNHIIMLSVPESAKPLTPDDDDVVFVTPPENHFRSSSESDQRKRVRVSSQGRIGDEAESKKVRASSPVEETQPVTETQPIKNVVVKTELIVLDDSDNETVILRDDSVGITRDQEPSQGRSFKGGLGSSKTDKCADKGKESVVNVGMNVGKEKASVDAVNGSLGSTKMVKRTEKGKESVVNVGKNVGKEKASVDAVNGGLGSIKMDKRAEKGKESVVNVGKNVGKEKASVDAVNGGLGSTKMDERAEKGKECVVNVGENVGKEKASVDGVNGGLGSSKTDKQADKSVINVGKNVGKAKASVDGVNGGLGSKKTVERRVQDNVLDVGNQKKVIKNGVNGNWGAGSSRNGFEEIDKFAYGNGIRNKKQGRRKLPKSVQGGEGNVGVEKELDFYGILEKLESQSLWDDGEEVDFVETAKKRGTVFPRPRWWDPDW